MYSIPRDEVIDPSTYVVKKEMAEISRDRILHAGLFMKSFLH